MFTACGMRGARGGCESCGAEGARAGAATWHERAAQWARGGRVRAHPRSRTRASHGGRRPAWCRPYANQNALHRENPAPSHQAGMQHLHATTLPPFSSRPDSQHGSWRLWRLTTTIGRRLRRQLSCDVATDNTGIYVDHLKFKTYFGSCFNLKRVIRHIELWRLFSRRLRLSVASDRAVALESSLKAEISKCW